MRRNADQRAHPRQRSPDRESSWKESLGNHCLEIYYRIRERLGLERIPQERIREQQILTPEKDAESLLREEDRQRLMQVILCLGAVMLLTVILMLQGRNQVRNTLTRPDYGKSDQEVELDLEANDTLYQVPLVLMSVQYTEQEREEAFDEAWAYVLEHALADNPDWDHISSPLALDSDTGVAGIRVSWRCEDTRIISSNGSLRAVEEDFPVSVEMTATLICDDWQRQETVTATVVSREKTEAEEQVQRWQELLAEALSDRTKQEIELPAVLDGEAVSYPEETDTSWRIFPVLGLAMAAALWLIPGQRRHEAMEKREKELELAYSELIWKLTVLLGAGLTVRGAWERIVSNYQKEREAGAEPVILYEEMQMTMNSLTQGVFEETAYAEFGRRCGLPCYLRLGSLLETNVRQGRKGLLNQMQSEAEEAFRGRLQLAKRQGEEASSKLLIPMMILFALVLGILMIPAMISF